MAPSSSTFTSAPDLPPDSTSIPNSNPDSIVTFCSLPLQHSEEELLLAKAKRRRQRALRMSREKQIPALTLRCASQFHTAPSSEASPHCFSTQKGHYAYAEGDVPHFCKETSSHSSPEGAIVIYDGRVLKSRMLKSTHSFRECSGGEGDVSDVGSDRGPDLFELRNWREGSSSSPSSSAYDTPLNVSKALSECSYEGPLNVTRAVTTECSSDDDTVAAVYGVPNGVLRTKLDNHLDDKEDEMSAEYWRLQADVLAAECKLLRVEKELALRKWNQECAKDTIPCPFEKLLNAACQPSSKVGRIKHDASKATHQYQVHENSVKDASQEGASKKLHSVKNNLNCFTQEALRRLEEISNRSSTQRMPLEDPTEALQKKLQGLLLAARSSALDSGSRMSSTSAHRSHEGWDYVEIRGNERVTRETMVNTRCFAETAALRKQLDLMSLELSETKDAAAYIRSEYRSMLSEEKSSQCGRDTDQMLGDEMYCKAAIRQIVAQVQAECEQWSQVQDILRSLQEEMAILIETRELSEARARQAEAQLLFLKEMVHDWRCRARCAEEEVMMLQSERQALKLRMQNMKHKHAAERRSWFKEGNAPKEAVELSNTDAQPSIVSGVDVEEQPRLANVGTQEDYALCESIVHSRNESSRSSIDLGTTTATSTTQRQTQRSIIKSLDFSNSSNEGNTSKSRVRSHRFTDQIRKIEPTRLDFCSKTSDVNSGARHKISGPKPKVELTRLECVEPAYTLEYKERKKARLFAFKENRSMSGPIETHAPFSAEPSLQRSSLGHAMSATQDLLDHVISSRAKSSLPSAPTSTPSRLPFGEIFNSPSSH